MRGNNRLFAGRLGFFPVTRLTVLRLFYLKRVVDVCIKCACRTVIPCRSIKADAPLIHSTDAFRVAVIRASSIVFITEIDWVWAG
jgi:hypothetical protein